LGNGINLLNNMELPKQRIGNKIYYVDMRLREFRNVKNPHDRITFGELYLYNTNPSSAISAIRINDE